MQNQMLLSSALAALVVSGGDEPFRSLDLDQALAAAEKEEKVVLIDFFTTWCEPCKRLDRTTWKDAKVVAWLEENTVAIKLDAEKEVDVAERYGVRAYPTMTFVRPDGSRLDQIVGYRAPGKFLSEAADALAGRTAVDRARSALAGVENDPKKRGNLADEFARAGRYDEALVEYLWCWDHGLEHDSSYSGVRVSFLLSDIEHLARVHPPAKEAMLERCDALAELVREGNADSRLIGDLVAVQERFGPPGRILELFDELAQDVERVAACRDLVEEIAPQLAKERRYEDLLKHGPDVAAMLRRRQAMVDRLEGELEKDEPGAEYLVSALETIRSRTIVEAGPYFEALVALGERPDLDQPSPDAVQDQILALSADGWTFYRMIQHATRAGDPSRARALVERAREALTDETDLRRIERAEKEIPEEGDGAER